MKPFNLEKCIAGEKVVTRDGDKVEMPTYNKNASADCRLACWVNGDLVSYTDSGKFFDDGEDSDFDLFMAEPTLYYAIIKSKHSMTGFSTSYLFYSEIELR